MGRVAIPCCDTFGTMGTTVNNERTKPYDDAIRVLKMTNPIKDIPAEFRYDKAYVAIDDAYNTAIKALENQKSIVEKLTEINIAINKKMREPQYQHEGEDWVNGLIMAENIVDDYMSKLKEGK